MYEAPTTLSTLETEQILFSYAKLVQLDPWRYSSDYQHTRHDHSPESDVQRVHIECRLCRKADRGQRHQQDEISACSMIFVQRLPVVHASKEHARKVELCKANQGLQEDQDVGD